MIRKHENHWAARISTLLLAIALWLVIRQRTAPVLGVDFSVPTAAPAAIHNQH